MGAEFYIYIGFGCAGLFFCGVIYAMYWAAKNGQMDHFDEQAASILEDKEPEGFEYDRFPVKKKRASHNA